ncbi:unnamed protein product, partial [Owenia fusiformis]
EVEQEHPRVYLRVQGTLKKLSPKTVTRRWSDWSRCSTTCGPGKKYRSRTRTYTGLPPCPGNSKETEFKNCDQPPCGCRWSDWGQCQASGRCSSTCGSGKRYGTRTRTKQIVLGGPPVCIGASSETCYRPCDNPPCEICPPRSHWKYDASPPWCCIDATWHQPYQNNLFKCEKISDGLEIIKSCPRGEKFKIFAWDHCYCYDEDCDDVLCPFCNGRSSGTKCCPCP